jgi:short-subunit dehydrogenase
LSKFGAKKGAWAVVTGCTDGLGKEFAFQLAQAGFNILLVARNVELLKSTAQEIGIFFFMAERITKLNYGITETKFNVKTQIHVIDFVKADTQEYAQLANTLQPLDIGVLGE